MSVDDLFLQHLVARTCAGCGGESDWELESLLPAELELFEGKYVGRAEWGISGASIVQRLFRIACMRCGRDAWTREVLDGCPNCEFGDYTKAVSGISRFEIPKSCSCGSTHLLVRGEFRATTRVVNEVPDAPLLVAVEGGPGFHVGTVDCLDCKQHVIPRWANCAACGSGPMASVARTG